MIRNRSVRGGTRTAAGLVALALVAAACGPWYERWGIKDDKELASYRAMPKLKEVLQRGSCDDMEHAARALEARGPAARSALELLSARMHGECFYRQRVAVARALGAIGEPALPTLEGLLAERDQVLRYLGAVGLGAVRQPEAEDWTLKLVLQVLGSQDELDDWGAREQAFLALKSRGAKAKAATGAILPWLSHETWQPYAVDCLLAIGQGSTEVLAALDQVAAGIEDPEERAAFEARIAPLRLGK